MTPLDRYVRRATRGLPPEKRKRAEEDLRGDITERTRELQLHGLSEEQALTRALTEFGQPGRVVSGLRSVHT